MQLSVLYFASVREAIGVSREAWSSEAKTVQALRAELAARGGAWAQALDASRALRCAVNQEMVADDTALQDGDEVAFFPPVTGG